MAEADQKEPQEPKAAPARRAKKPFKVSAPMVTARTENDRIVYLYRGDAVPDGIASDSLEHLKSLGFIKADDASSVD